MGKFFPLSKPKDGGGYVLGKHKGHSDNLSVIGRGQTRVTLITTNIHEVSVSPYCSLLVPKEMFCKVITRLCPVKGSMGEPRVEWHPGQTVS